MPMMLSRDQVRRIDELAVERYGMCGLVLMENAGRSASDLIEAEYGPGGSAVVFCGAGNNGGDGCVIARHLINRGWSVRVVMTGGDDKFTPDTATNYRIIGRMGVDVVVALDAASQQLAVSTIGPDDVVIDALLGTGFRGAVRAPTAELIRAVNAVRKRAAVAIDVPSGFDCDTGSATGSTIRADLTITFVAIKPGFLVSDAAAWLGRVAVAEIGAPAALVHEIAASRS